MHTAYTAFAAHWGWTPREVDTLMLDEFWHFLQEFDRQYKESKRKQKKRPSGYEQGGDPTGWLRNPRYKR